MLKLSIRAPNFGIIFGFLFSVNFTKTNRQNMNLKSKFWILDKKKETLHIWNFKLYPISFRFRFYKVCVKVSLWGHCFYFQIQSSQIFSFLMNTHELVLIKIKKLVRKIHYHVQEGLYERHLWIVEVTTKTCKCCNVRERWTYTLLAGQYK